MVIKSSDVSLMWTAEIFSLWDTMDRNPILVKEVISDSSGAPIKCFCFHMTLK